MTKKQDVQSVQKETDPKVFQQQFHAQVTVEQFASDDPGPFTLLCAGYTQTMKAFAYNRFHENLSEQDMEDVVQIAFMNLWNKRAEAQFTDTQHIVRYLYRSVSNRGISEIDRRSRAADLWRDNSFKNAMHQRSALKTPQQQVESDSGVSYIETAIDHLPKETGKTIRMYAREDIQYNELSDAIGVPIGTIKSRIFDGRKKLRKALAS